MNEPNKACNLAKDAFDKAIADLDELEEEVLGIFCWMLKYFSFTNFVIFTYFLPHFILVTL